MKLICKPCQDGFLRQIYSGRHEVFNQGRGKVFNEYRCLAAVIDSSHGTLGDQSLTAALSPSNHSGQKGGVFPAAKLLELC